MEYFGKAFEIMDRMVKMGENLPEEDSKKGMGMLGVVTIVVATVGGIITVALKGVDVIRDMAS